MPFNALSLPDVSSSFLDDADALAHMLGITKGGFTITFHHRRPVKLYWTHRCQQSLCAPASEGDSPPAAETAKAMAHPSSEQVSPLIERMFRNVQLDFGDVEFIVTQDIVSDVQFLIKMRRNEVAAALNQKGLATSGNANVLKLLADSGTKSVHAAS